MSRSATLKPPSRRSFVHGLAAGQSAAMPFRAGQTTAERCAARRAAPGQYAAMQSAVGPSIAGPSRVERFAARQTAARQYAAGRSTAECRSTRIGAGSKTILGISTYLMRIGSTTFLMPRTKARSQRNRRAPAPSTGRTHFGGPAAKPHNNCGKIFGAFDIGAAKHDEISSAAADQSVRRRRSAGAAGPRPRQRPGRGKSQVLDCNPGPDRDTARSNDAPNTMNLGKYLPANQRVHQIRQRLIRSSLDLGRSDFL